MTDELHEQRLFTCVAGAPRPRSAWGRASALAVAAHVVSGALLASQPAAAAKVAVAIEQASEVVFYHLPPPPPPPAPGPKRAARRAKPLIVPVAPAPLPEELPPVEPEPEPLEQPVDEPAVVEGPTSSDASATEAASSGGVVGGVVGGQEGGLVGATSQPLQLSQVLRPPKVLQQTQPEYPRGARLHGVQGLVLVRVIIGVDGRIEPKSAQVLRSVPALDEAAIEAIVQWRFTPALGPNSQPVRVVVDIPLNFSLH